MDATNSHNLLDTDAAWQYAHSYYYRHHKGHYSLAICLIALVLAVGSSLYLWGYQGDLEGYLKICGPNIICYCISTIALVLHHRADCRARGFACYVQDSGLCEKADIRALYSAWQA